MNREREVDRGTEVPVGASPLRAYMAWDESIGCEEGAVLVFAPSSREARVLATPVVSAYGDGRWTDVRVRWLRSGCAHLRTQDGPHVVEDVPSCRSCLMWWEYPLNAEGLCEGCAQDDFDWDSDPISFPATSHPTNAVPRSPASPERD